MNRIKETHIMQKIGRVILALGALTCSVPTVAQSFDGPVTREQLLAELARLEQAGYSPSAGESANYPEDIQAAEAKIATQDEQQRITQSVGGVTSGSSSNSGSRVPYTPAGSTSASN
jgi:hypothetical protein